MEVLLSEIDVPDITNGSLSDVDEPFVLWVIHADMIPPHIGISREGYFYSLKATGKDDKLPVDQLLSLIDRKNITTICFILNFDTIEESVERIFNRYEKTIPFKITCLAPIKEILNINDAEKLADLLMILEKTNKIEKVVGFNSEKFTGIKNYSLDQIHERLDDLANG